MKSGGSYHVSYIWSYHSWSETSWRAVWVLIDSGTNFTKPGTCQSVLKAALCLSICRETCPQNNRAIKIELMLSLCQEIWKTQQGPQDWKSSVFIPVPKKGNAKECSNYCTVALISHASNEFKILQARLQQYVNRELPNVQAGFYKRQRNQRSNCQHPLDHRKSKSSRKKHLLLLYWLCQSLWLCGSQ